MKHQLLVLLFFAGNFCGAQNLVPNPSFEDYYACPTSTGQVDSCIDWFRVHNTPDYFSLCSPYPVAIPDNALGYQMPFDGNAYMGLLTYVWWQFWREIIGTQLLDALIPGKNYHVSMRVSRGNWTNQAYNCAASSKLGVRFTTNPYTVSDTPVINNYAQLYVDSVVTDTLNWVLLSWNYVPDSAYKYLYIGNFFDDAHTDTTVINAPLGQFGMAYYYIDSINVFCADVKCQTDVHEPEVGRYLVSFDHGSKTLKVVSDEKEDISISIYNCNGRLLNSTIGRQDIALNLYSLSAGFYIVRLETTSKSITKKMLIY